MYQVLAQNTDSLISRSLNAFELGCLTKNGFVCLWIIVRNFAIVQSV